MNFSDVKVLIHSDGPADSQEFPDSSPAERVVTAYGNVKHSTEQAQFGLTGIKFDGSGDYLTIPFVVNDFQWWLGCTIDLWVYEPTTWAGWARSTTTPALIGHMSPTSVSNYFSFGVCADGRLGLYYYTGSVKLLISTATVPLATWQHLRMTVSAGVIYLFIHGVLVASGAVSGTPLTSASYPLTIGQYYNTCITGYVDEILYTSESLSTADFTPPTSPWLLVGKIYFEQVQQITTLMNLSQSQVIGMAPRLYHQITQIVATARRINLSFSQVFDTTIPISLQHDQVFNNLAQVALLTTQVMRNYGAPVALEMLQTWAAYNYNLVYLPVVQLIGAQLDSVLQEIQFSVMVAASPVGVVDCDFDRKGFCNVATLLLRSRSEWDNKLVGDPVVLTVLGEQYQMIVTNKPQDEQITQGTYEVGYLLECASTTCQLAEGLNPDLAASRVTGSFPAGTLLTEILDFLTDGVCSYNLAVPDYPTGGYDFEDAERMAALREVLPEQYGWIIETDQAGVLQLRQWRKPEIGGAGQKTLTMSRKSLTPPANTVYTQVIVRNYNQQDGTSGLRLEVVDNGDGTGTIYGYSVPWTDAFSIFDSEDSSAPSLLITGGAVEEVLVEDKDVEFVDGKASLSKPCYSTPVIDWGNNDSLSPVTYTESGTMSTATEPGYSVTVKVTYTTRRKKWTFDNRKIDVSQVRLRYD